VTKKKDSVALFEVISKNRQVQGESGMGVPDWMGKGAEPPSPGQEAAVSVASKAPSKPIEPLLSTATGRLTLSLNYVSCMVAALALVLLLALAFWLGRWSARSAAQAAPGTEQGSQQSAEKANNPASPADKQIMRREDGKYYLVIQGVQGVTGEHKADADAIVQWLAKQTVKAETRELGGPSRQYVVLSFDGFDSTDSASAKKFVETIEELGRRYGRDGGKYAFKQNPASPWFIAWQAEYDE
jgi:hypothetical protein